MNEIRTVGRYEIVQVLGRGGMAVVYLARQTDLDRFVALKELSRVGEAAQDPSFAHRFIRESRLAGSLAHPNIVVVHEYFEHEGTPYISMEYVPGGSLRPYVGTLSPAQIGGVLEGILAGLAHAEHVGVIHRDLKPENTMVTEEGRIKITDFGIARATSSVATKFVTATGTTVGTPSYMAPEQAMGKNIGPWTDLYTTGVMAYELLAGQLPFPQDEAPMAILMRHINEEPTRLHDLRPDLSPALADWVMALLRKKPEERPDSAEPVWHDLEDILITVLGPRWRRDARLPSEPGTRVTDQPLTPAPFDSRRTPTPAPGPAAAEPASGEPSTPVAAEGESQYFSYPQGARGEPPPAPPEWQAEPTPPPVTAAGAETTAPAPAPTQPSEAPPTAPVDPPPGLREQPTATPGSPPAAEAPPAEPPGPATPPTQETPAPSGGGPGGRRIGPAVAVLVAAVAAAVVGFAVLGGGDNGGESSGDGGDGGGDGSGPEIQFEELATDDYRLDVPAGWTLIADEDPVGEGLQTRLQQPNGEVLIGINHFPSDDLTPEEYVRQEEDKKADDEIYELHDLKQVEGPGGKAGTYWEFDVDQPVLGPSRAFAYIFDFDGTLYRVQGSAKLESGQNDVAAAIAEHGAETLEVF